MHQECSTHRGMLWNDAMVKFSHGVWKPLGSYSPPLLTRERVFWNAHQLLSHVLKSFRGYSNSESLCAGLFIRAWCVWKYGMEVICLVALRFTVCRPSNSDRTVDAFLTTFTFTSSSIYAAQWIGHAWFRAFPALWLVCLIAGTQNGSTQMPTWSIKPPLASGFVL